MRRLPFTCLQIAIVAIAFGSTTMGAAPAKRGGGPVATFSILGYDPKTGEVGGAVQSRVFSVGNGVLWAEAGVGAVATQAYVDVSYGPKALNLLRKGLKPAEVVRKVREADLDPQPRDWPKAARQFAVMNARGEVVAFTGPKADVWAGHRLGKHCSAQGNILAGKAVVDGMVEAFEKTQGHLSYRLMAALEAGQAAGGDVRGMQSAAMLIVKKKGGVWLNQDVVLRLQVDDHPQPIQELRRLVTRAAEWRGARARPLRGVLSHRCSGYGPPGTLTTAYLNQVAPRVLTRGRVSMRVRDVMTRGVEFVHPNATLQEAARRMGELNIGSLPISDGKQLFGIVTDRDITVRATAMGVDPRTTAVHTVMTPEVHWCFEDQDVFGAARSMEEFQIRRLVVLNREKQLSGMVSLGDLAVKMHDEAVVGEMLEEISEPAQPQRIAA